MRSYNQNPDGSGNGPVTDFINRILKRLTELQFYDSQTVKVEQTTRGTRFHVKGNNADSGQLVYVKACLQDGTECYVPINIHGTVYRNPGTGTTEVTVDSGSVPTGSNVII